MFFSLLVLLAGAVVAGLIAIYVSFTRRGYEVPRAPWLGEALRRGVEALPTLDPAESLKSTDELDLIHRHLVDR